MPDETPTEPVPVPTLMPTAMAAPAAAPLAPPDQGKLDEAVAFLNRALCESGVRLAVTVSDYVVATFFGGDPAKLASRNSHKGASYAALRHRPDLEMGATTLQRLVRIGLQAKLLPADVAAALSPSQHRALLVVPEPEQKIDLARTALAEHWTVAQLQDAAESRKPQAGKRQGRPTLPEAVKKVAALSRAVDALGAPEQFAALLAGLDGAARAEIGAELRRVAGRIGQLGVAELGV